MLTIPVPPRPVARGRERRTTGPWVLALLIAVAVLIALSVMVGSRMISPETVWRVLWERDASQDALVVHDLRVPRTVLGLVAGVALGVSGALIMAVTRNPLADPGILGVNAGAHLAVALSISLFGLASFSQYVWFAFLGAIVATAAVYLIGSAGRGTATPVRLTVTGMAFGAALSGIATGVTLLDQRTFDLLRDWNAGSLVGRDPALTAQLLPFVAIGVVIAVVLARSLNAVALGDETARGLGIDVRSVRVWAVIAVTLLCGATTAVVGPISFVGLMVPHAVRWLVGPDQRSIMLLTVIASPALLLAADILGRLLVIPDEMPVGVVVALVGAPVLIILARRKRAPGL